MQSPSDVLTYSEIFFKFAPLNKHDDTAGGFFFNGIHPSFLCTERDAASLPF